MVDSVSYREVLARLRLFIRKYYLNKTIRGLILSFLIFSITIGVLILSNQGLKPDIGWRTTSFWIFIISGCLLVGWLVVIPLLQFIGVGRRLNFRRAERVLSAHFTDMKDTLLNMLELAEGYQGGEDNSLLLASIEDKADRIKWYKFGLAVPVRKLVKFVPYVIAVIIIGFAAYFVWPDFVKEGYARTINYNTEFDLPPVYKYKVLNDSLVVALGQDLELRIEPEFDKGEESVYLRMGQNREPMTPEENGVLSYVIKAVNNTTSFRLQYMGVNSDSYEVRVIPTPEFIQFNIQYFPPKYTGIEAQVLSNEGDLDIPAGTNTIWNINAMFTDNAILVFGSDTIKASKVNEVFSAKKALRESGRYKISLSNNKTDEKPELGFSIRVRPDLYPEIDISELRDSVLETQFFFQGFVSDDYGFKKLDFIVEKMDGSHVFNEEIHLNEGASTMRFYHAKDMSELGHEGEQLYYYFSVWDNDGVNGSKRTDSKKMAYRNLTYTELVSKNKDRALKIEETLSEGKDIAEQIKEKVDDMKMAQLMSEQEDWEEKSQLKELEEMQELLEEMMNNIQNENQIKGVEQESFNLDNERLMQKQEEIQELLEQIMDEELKQLLEEFEKLVEENNKGKKLEKLDEIDMNLEKLERQLDVSLELLKKYEVEKEVFRTAEELEDMAKEMENLDVEKDSSRLNELQEEFEKVDKNYQEQVEKNEELKEPMEMEEFKEEREDISEDMEEMNKPGNKKNQGKKKDAAEKKMKQLGEQMKSMMMGGAGEQEQIDIENIRQLVRKLNDFSFKQEELIELVAKINVAHPDYARAGIEERELKEKFGVIKDTLVSLGYKNPQIAKLLNQEMFHVETALENLMKSYQNTRKSQVGIEQQNIMKGANELAIRLDEIVQSAQNQSGQGGGQGQFTDSKPKSGKDKVGEMKGQQQSLKKQLEGMINQMKQGKRGKEDKKGLAKMLADREMMRQAMEKLKNSGELGEKTRGKISEAQKLMEEVEKDIIYDRLGDHTIRREKMIESKMLEAEQAEMEREKENRRESREFRGTIKPPDQKVWENFEQQKKRTLDLMKYRDIKLKEFYRKKYYDYLEQLEKQKK